MNILEIYQLFLEFPKITTDSRNVVKNSIFFALKGANFNGNQYAANAIEEGCCYAIIDENKYKTDSRFILVDDVLTTLQDLGIIHRININKTIIIAITGTNGKTTTKELLKSVLSKKFIVISTQGNLNNHIGVPLTILSMNYETEVGIVEMGANHIGEIKLLCKIAQPDYGIITNIGKAHLEGFGSYQGIIKAKSELYEFLSEKNKIAFINSDNELLTSIINFDLRRITYGNSAKSDYRGQAIEADPFLKIQYESKTTVENKTVVDHIDIETKLVGKYNFENVMASISTGKYFGVSDMDIKQAIETYVPSNNRSQLLQTEHNTLLLDFYNANPSSMELAIINFAELKVINKTLILGDMFELGSDSEKEHLKIIRILQKLDFLNVMLIGKYFHLVSVNTNYLRFQNTDDFINRLISEKLTSRYILIKGSRGMYLERIINYL
jgi:UDP-N-acetylmuramoyl-tripeptide--D-alanyl-D-alanine ligase